MAGQLHLILNIQYSKISLPWTLKSGYCLETKQGYCHEHLHCSRQPQNHYHWRIIPQTFNYCVPKCVSIVNNDLQYEYFRPSFTEFRTKLHLNDSVPQNMQYVNPHMWCNTEAYTRQPTTWSTFCHHVDLTEQGGSSSDSSDLYLKDAQIKSLLGCQLSRLGASVVFSSPSTQMLWQCLNSGHDPHHMRFKTLCWWYVNIIADFLDVIDCPVVLNKNISQWIMSNKSIIVNTSTSLLSSFTSNKPF
jgi:hypothetical protein